MSSWDILTLTAGLPLLGALCILFIRGDEKVVAQNARSVAMWTSLITFALSLAIWWNFETATAGFQFVHTYEWFPALGIRFKVGVDGISMLFVILTTLLTPICILSAWDAVKTRVREYMLAFLVLETLMIGTFIALDLFTFYIFFEGVLIPMFIIIGVWGGPRRVYSAFKFFLYTLLGSVLMLVAMLAMAVTANTTDIPGLMAFGFSPEMQTWLWLAFFASFAVKVPMWPVHTWLPDAHVEAPTAGSVILAGVLLKFGGYGFLRFSLPMMPLASEYFAPLVFALSCIAIVYTSLVALAQSDMKKLIAYSSVAHMGFVTIGIFSVLVSGSADARTNVQGIEGAIFQMLSHGVVSAALFLIVGVVYDRIHSREIDSYGGLVHRMPIYAGVFMLFMLASVGLPGTSGFVGEFLVLAGAFQTNTWVAFIAATGLILGAAYMLWLYRRVIFGELTKKSLMTIRDLSPREIVVFAPLIVIVIWMGIYPSSFLDVMHASVENLVNNYRSALCTAKVIACPQSAASALTE